MNAVRSEHAAQNFFDRAVVFMRSLSVVGASQRNFNRSVEGGW
jgi:hypothetical protein